MIIKLITEQAEWIWVTLENWKHNSLAERFKHANRALVTETEVQLILEALEEEKLEIEYHLSEDDSPKNKEKEKEKEEKALLWDLEVIGSTIASLQSQLKGGQPIEPKGSNDEETETEK